MTGSGTADHLHCDEGKRPRRPGGRAGLRAPRTLSLLALALWAGCTSPTPPLPDAREVDPPGGLEGVATRVTVRGATFRPRVTLDFDRPAASAVGTDFQVFFGETAATDVTWLGDAEVAATAPGTLAVGTYDVRLVDPRGLADVVPGGFTVAARAGFLSIEDAPGGLGAPVATATLPRGASRTFHAVARGDDGGFLANASGAAWSLDGGIGTLAVDGAGAATLTATGAGSGVVQASHPAYGSASTGLLTVVDCGGAGDCVDACHSVAQCVAGACSFGPADLDADGDGYVDAACAGGTDCDDALRTVNPGASEAGYATAACEDGADNDCDGRPDALDPDCAPNSAPVARAVVTPPAGAPGDTFVGSAAGTSDRESAAGELSYAWDWDDDGVFEANGVSTSHQFPAAGLRRVWLRVRDPQGLEGVTSFLVVVSAPGASATVTTGADESDPGATPASPGGAGFSLREAVAWADRRSGRDLVLIPAGTVVALTRQLSVDDDDGVVLVGDGAVIDGAGIPGGGASCLEVDGRDHALLGLEIRNCPGWPIYLLAASSFASRCAVHDNTYGVEWAGTGNTFGPGNRAWANGSHGVEVAGRATLVDNVLTGNAGPGVILRSGASDSVLVGNVVAGNTAGVRGLSQCQRVALRFNTLHGNTGPGLELANNTTGHRLLNTVVSGNQGWGVDVGTATFAAFDANDFFGNTQGPCRSCPSLGPATLQVDPQYLDAAGGDLRPDLKSPLVNAGLDTGDDRTPATPGDYLGPAPDLGAFEVR